MEADSSEKEKAMPSQCKQTMQSEVERCRLFAEAFIFRFFLERLKACILQEKVVKAL